MEFNRARAALLSIDFQQEWVDLYAGPELLDRVAQVQDAARRAGIPVIHVYTVLGAAYRNGLPLTQYQQALVSHGWALEGSSAAEIHSAVAPSPGERVIAKQHEGPFIGTDLEQILRRLDVHFLVVAGIPTRAAVCNIASDGPDRFFDTILLSDCCNDADSRVHRVLMTKVLTHQAQVVTSAEWLSALTAQRRAV